MGLVVISNKPVKKGIEIPEIEFALSNENKTLTLSAIDKVKYQDYLSLNNYVFATESPDDSLISQSTVYTGDELVLNSDTGFLIVIFGQNKIIV